MNKDEETVTLLPTHITSSNNGRRNTGYNAQVDPNSGMHMADIHNEQGGPPSKPSIIKKVILVIVGIALVVGLSVTGILLAIQNSAPLCSSDISSVECARKIMTQHPLIDGHNDLPWNFRQVYNDTVNNTVIPDSWHTNMTKITEGVLGAQFWSVFVPCSMQGKDAVRNTLEQIDTVKKLALKYSSYLELAYSASDIERIFSTGKVASLVGIEGGHQVDSSLGTLRMMYILGARYMTLSHSCNNEIADSESNVCNGDAYCSAGTCVDGKCSLPPQGVSSFGKSVIREMNRLGMLVDISHVSAVAMRDALQFTKSPLIFSHSNAFSVCNHTRNAPDDVLLSLKANNGVIMVTFVPRYLTCSSIANITDVADHIDYIAYGKCPTWNPDCNPGGVFPGIGVDHIGIGSDFDGIDDVPQGLENVSKFPDLVAELLDRQYSIEDVAKIIGGNTLRVLYAAESVAAEMANEFPEEDWLNTPSTCRTGQ